MTNIPQTTVSFLYHPREMRQVCKDHQDLDNCFVFFSSMRLQGVSVRGAFEPLSQTTVEPCRTKADLQNLKQMDQKGSAKSRSESKYYNVEMETLTPFWMTDLRTAQGFWL